MDGCTSDFSRTGDFYLAGIKVKKKFKKFGVLPGQPSKLIRLALKDLEAVEKSKRFVVDMNEWFRPNGQCAVCLAGSVMAKTLKVSTSKRKLKSLGLLDSWGEVIPDKFKKEMYALQALNYFRLGECGWAFRYLDLTKGSGVPFDCMITDYHSDPEEFKDQMHQLAGELEDGGY